MRPDQTVPTQECMLKVSLQPLRLNVDQVQYVAFVTPNFTNRNLYDNFFLCKSSVTWLSDESNETESFVRRNMFNCQCLV